MDSVRLRALRCSARLPNQRGHCLGNGFPAKIRLCRALGLEFLQLTKADKAIMAPLMRRLLDDPDPNFQFGAIIYFCDVDPEEAEAAGLFKKFPQYRDYMHPHNPASNRPADK